MGFLIIDIVPSPFLKNNFIMHLWQSQSWGGASYWSDHLGWHLQKMTVECVIKEGSAY